MSQAGLRSSGGGGGSNVQTLTGNSGGAVGPTANNINVVGSGNVTVTGNAGTSTLTITSTASLLGYKNVNSSPYTVLTTDDYLSVDCSAGPITLRFPNAATLSQTFVIKDRTGSALTHNITVTTVGGSVTIDGATSVVMNSSFESMNLMGNGTSYEIW